MRLTIRPDGKTAGVTRAAETSVACGQVVECILDSTCKPSLPKPKRGSVQAEFPIVLIAE